MLFRSNIAPDLSTPKMKLFERDVMLVVTIVTTDPQYLREPFIISSHFKKQADNAGWKPTPCSARW